jgi:hypothetical protein
MVVKIDDRVTRVSEISSLSIQIQETTEGAERNAEDTEADIG